MGAPQDIPKVLILFNMEKYAGWTWGKAAEMIVGCSAKWGLKSSPWELVFNPQSGFPWLNLHCSDRQVPDMGFYLDGVQI